MDRYRAQAEPANCFDLGAQMWGHGLTVTDEEVASFSRMAGYQLCKTTMQMGWDSMEKSYEEYINSPENNQVDVFDPAFMDPFGVSQ